MISVGGSSYNNGIKFVATNYSVNFESYDNSTKIFLRKTEGEKTSKLLDFMSNIPLVRGIVSIVRNNKFILFIMIIDIMAGMNSNSQSSSFSSIFVIIMFIIFLTIIIIKMLKNIKSTFQYHGAEHKVIFTNYKEEPITLENCRKSPRINDDCGTMLVVLLIFVYIILKLITLLFGIKICGTMIISTTIAYELFLLNRNAPVVCLLFKLGYWFQEHVCTIEPSDFQLNQAIEAFKLLERAETGQIPEEELQELLNNGKQISFLNKLF